jgi:ornithine cyclodeaminase/alanine dehydrogenase-like protein (mu-crystallin family)
MSHPGRSGLPWQDLAIACQVYRAAERHGRGVQIDLLS